MLAAYLASAALVVVLSLLAGAALVVLCGRCDLLALSPAFGLGALLIATGVTTDLGGGESALALVLGGLAVGSLAVLARDVRRARPRRAAAGENPLAGLRSALPGGLAAALLTCLIASLPFIAAGRIGILGVGLVNDDMASHLLLADWIREGFRPEPVLVDQGYPLGPHSLVAGIGWALGARTIDVFAGLTTAIPILTALTVLGVLRGDSPAGATGPPSLQPAVQAPSERAAGRLGRFGVVLASALVALPYLAAAYLAQEAFKEPIMALLLLAFALALGGVGARPRRNATAAPPILGLVPLAVLAAATVYVYSFPGLAWLAGTGVVFGAVRLAATRIAGRASRPSEQDHGPERSPAGPALLAALAGLAALALLSAVDWPRLLDFADFRALDPARANEGGLGNLPGQISPLEALGVWPTSEFRLQPGSGGLPAGVFYVGGLLALAALGAGLPGWLRRYGPAVPAALVAALVVYVAARGFGTVYTSAKALAVASPLVMLVALGGLLGSRRASDRREQGPPGERQEATSAPPPSRRWTLTRAPIALLAVAFGLAAAGSSFLVLRQAPVGPADHAEELAQIRPLVEGRDVLFLGRDNFVGWELRGSRPYTHVRNFYDPYFVEPNFELADVGSKFDFDSVAFKALLEFPFVLTTRAAYASGPPPGYRVVRVTESYVLWRRGPTTAGREAIEAGPEPGARLDCGAARGDEVAVWPRAPVGAAWSPDGDLTDGEAVTASLDLPPGEWWLSLAYDATRPVEITGPELNGPEFGASLPGNLDYRGVTPPWALGGEPIEGGRAVELTATVEPPPALGRLLGASSSAHLGPLYASPAGPSFVAGLEPPSPGAGSKLSVARAACGRYADWSTPTRTAFPE